MLSSAWGRVTQQSNLLVSQLTLNDKKLGSMKHLLPSHLKQKSLSTHTISPFMRRARNIAMHNMAVHSQNQILSSYNSR